MIYLTYADSLKTRYAQAMNNVGYGKVCLFITINIIVIAFCSHSLLAVWMETIAEAVKSARLFGYVGMWIGKLACWFG